MKKTQPQESVKAPEGRTVTIKAPDLRTVIFNIEGTSPYCQLRFSEKAENAMKEKMELGSQQAGKKRAKPPRDFNDDLEQAKHLSTEGWIGIPASAFRQAIISACRLVGFKMTLAKLSVKVIADGYDKVDGMPLVKIIGTPERNDMHVRNATGVADIRVRPLWRTWSAKVAIEYDADQFTHTDVANLLNRVGAQVGIGEGRADSRDSAGIGWGYFALK